MRFLSGSNRETTFARSAAVDAPVDIDRGASNEAVVLAGEKHGGTRNIIALPPRPNGMPATVALADSGVRCQHGSSGVILMRERRAKQRHASVPEKLIDGAFVTVDLGQCKLEETIQQPVHRLLAEALGQLASS
jgi:hypothetical protein